MVWQVAVIGTGLMGQGIATWLVDQGHHVRVFDQVTASAERTVASIVERSAAGQISLSSTLASAVSGCDLVIEAVAEHLPIKHALLSAIERENPGGIIASNTSTFMPTSLASVLSQPELLIITHFFNPANDVPLVEIVRSRWTLSDVTEAVVGLLRSGGKHPVVLGREIPGFVANRLQAAILRESLALVRAGVATNQEIDEVVRSSIGPRWSVAGPFQVADIGGLDVFLALTEQLFPSLDNSEDAPAEIASLVAAGRLGAKTGAGFYEHSDEELAHLRERITGSLTSHSAPLPCVSGSGESTGS